MAHSPHAAARTLSRALGLGLGRCSGASTSSLPSSVLASPITYRPLSSSPAALEASPNDRSPSQAEKYQPAFPPIDDGDAPSAAASASAAGERQDKPNPDTPEAPMAPEKERVYTDFLRDGMPRPGDARVVELDEENRPMGVTGPSREELGGQSTVWHKQSIDDTMQTGNLPRQSDEDIKRMDAANPSGVDAEALRPEARPGMHMPLTVGEYVSKRTKEVASGVWETLKHGVNNPHQPQVKEELRKTEPGAGRQD